MTIWLALTLFTGATLYEQSTSRLLAARFRAAGLSYMVADAESGRIMASNWTDPSRPVPAGSLMKPFLAGAVSREIVMRCRAERCWLPAGHGRLDLIHAIAHSCNSYFFDAAARLDADHLAHVLSRFGLTLPRDMAVASRIGLGTGWPLAPASLLNAYRLLIRDASESAVRAGMRLSAAEGTARLLGADALAKTGTAACSHSRRSAGDGFVFAAWPAEHPRYLLLVRVHNTTGANAARTGGEILRVLRDGR